MKIRILFFIAIVITYTSCDLFSLKNDGVYNSKTESLIDTGDKTNPEERLWTIIIYMCADNNLETAALNDIYEMEVSRLNTDKINILFLLDRSPSYNASSGDWTGTRLYKLKTGRKESQTSIISTQLNCDDLGLSLSVDSELDMSDPNILSKLIRFSIERFPASNYGLIMWGHGSGWKSDGEVIHEEKLYKGFSYDESTDSYMTLLQLGKALKNGLGDLKLNFLGFDTCYGGEIEVMYELRHYADYGCGSEGLVSSDGWNYETLFNCFENSNLKDTDVLMESVLYQFKKQYEGSSRASIVFCDLNKISDYSAAFDLFCSTAALNINSRVVRDSVFETLYTGQNCKTERYTYGKEGFDVYLDCTSVVENLTELLHSSENEIDAASTCYVNAEKSCVIKNWASDRSKGGLGVYFQSLGAGGLLLSSFNSNYINGKSYSEIDFVKNCKGYVPTKNKNESLLDKIFYCQFE